MGGWSRGGAERCARYPPTHPPACPPSSLQPLMRADFTLFDEYEHSHAGAPAFSFPLTAFWGSADRRIKEHMVQVRVRVGEGGCGRPPPQRHARAGRVAVPAANGSLHCVPQQRC